jgi:hypothetical protein
MGEDCSIISEVVVTEVSACTAEQYFSPVIIPVDSGKPTNELIGVVGEELKDPTDGGEVNEAGARTVRVRSSDVKFEARKAKTWEFDNSFRRGRKKHIQ